MMVTTHALAGFLLGLALVPLAPGEAVTLALAGAVGGVVPDLDALGAHRKDLHFPVYGSALAVVLFGGAVVVRSVWLVVATAAVAAAALHAVSEVVGGGRSLRPWAESVERAVYCHASGRWWRPRALIPYDGSIPDLAVAALLATIALTAVDSSVLQLLAGGLLVASVAYALVRKRVPALVAGLARRVRGVRR